MAWLWLTVAYSLKGVIQQEGDASIPFNEQGEKESEVKGKRTGKRSVNSDLFDSNYKQGTCH